VCFSIGGGGELIVLVGPVVVVDWWGFVVPCMAATSMRNWLRSERTRLRPCEMKSSKRWVKDIMRARRSSKPNWRGGRVEAREGAADVLYGERRWVEEWIRVGSMVIVAILPGDEVELVEIVQYNFVAYLGLAAVVLGMVILGLAPSLRATALMFLTTTCLNTAMCGIFVSVAIAGQATAPNDTIKDLLCKRGPDSHQICERIVTSGVDGEYFDAHLLFFASVLSLRGTETVHQPLVDESSGIMLCWNGEAWKIDGKPVTNNDATSVLEILVAAIRADEQDESCRCNEENRVDVAVDHVPHKNVYGALRSISGPFAFALWDPINSRLYLGRDRLGRRSLLMKTKGCLLFLSSVTDGTEGWTEVDATGMFVLNFKQKTIPSHCRLPSSNNVDEPFVVASHLSCDYQRWDNVDTQPDVARVFPIHDPPGLGLRSPAVTKLEQLLRQSLVPRLMGIPFRDKIGTSDMPSEKSMSTGCTPVSIIKNALGFQHLSSGQRPPRIAVLFSGGLDCTVLARLINDILPIEEEIDLLNVAFHNPRVHGSELLQEGGKAMLNSSYDSCPDRFTAKSSLSELRKVCPTRTWRLVEINVPYSTTLEYRDLVKMLIYPHNTEMDLSIAYALFFASRGIGHSTDPESGARVPYETPARVLFSGLGADELFGGYQRHATAFERHGLEGLVAELELDINRLGQRNLGRDDRIISRWGKEARYPYLDEDLVNWAVAAPVHEKCGFGQSSPNNQDEHMPFIEPGKLVLRLLAHKLGLTDVAREKKRAIQFGARTAKMDVGKTKGTQVIK